MKFILSPFNEMQFSDRVQIESGPFHLYGPYGSTTRETPFTPVKCENVLSPLNEMQFSDRIGLARSDKQYRSTRRISKLNQIVCIGQPSVYRVIIKWIACIPHSIPPHLISGPVVLSLIRTGWSLKETHSHKAQFIKTCSKTHHKHI